MSNFSGKWRTIQGASSGRIRRSIFEYGSPIWEVMNDGFFGYSSVDYDWRDANDVNKVTRWLMAAHAPNVSEIWVDPNLREFNVKLDESVSTDQFLSNLRESFVFKETATWGVSQAICEMRPQEYEGRLPTIKPQQGLALRCQEDGNKRRHIVAWYDVVIGNPHLINGGVWDVNLDGSGFLNRQTNKAMNLQVGLTATAGERTNQVVTVSGLSAPSLKVDDWINVIWTKIVATGVSMTRSGNVVTATGLPVGHGIPADGMITVDQGSPASFDITEVEITGAPDATSLTWAETGANESGTGRIRDKSNDRRPARVIEIVDATTFKYEDLGQNRDQPAVTGAADMAIMATSAATINRIFPYWMHIKVQGSILYVRCWNRDQTVPPFGDPDRSLVTDLDFPTTTLTVTAASRTSGIATLTVTETAILSKLHIGGRIDVNLVDNTYDTTTGTITGINIGASQVSLVDTSPDDAIGSTGTATVYGGSTAALINDHPTPIGSGAIGMVAAHEGYDPRATARFGGIYGDNQFNSDIVATVFPDLEQVIELETVNPITSPVTGSGTGNFGGLGAATGVRKVLGQATSNFGGLGTATGIRRTFGQATGSFGGLGSLSGVRRVVGSATGNFGGFGTASGTITPRISHDFSKEHAATGDTGNFNWTHSPVTADPKGILVRIFQAGSGDHVTNVTYDGVALTRLSFHEKTTGEVLAVYTYLLGSNVPETDPATVAVTTDGTVQSRAAVSTSLAGTGDVALDVLNTLSSDSLADPSLTLNYTDGLSDWVAYGAFMSGLNTTITTTESGTTHEEDIDLGAVVGMTCRKSGQGGTSTTVGYTAAAEDVLFVGVVLKQFAGVQGSGTGQFGGLGVATGTRRVVGSATGSFGGLGSATGVVRRLGTATGTFGGLGTSTGVRRVRGVATGNFGGLGTATGTRRVRATATGNFGGFGEAFGFPGTPPVQGSGTGQFGGLGTAIGVVRKLGQATGSWGFAGTATGVRRVVGAGSASFGPISAAIGLRRVRGSGAANWGFSGTVQGVRRVYGSATADWSWSGNASGVIGPLFIPKTNAQTVGSSARLRPKVQTRHGARMRVGSGRVRVI